ncbi:MAG: OmpA family protein [Rickettsiales bacterium]
MSKKHNALFTLGLAAALASSFGAARADDLKPGYDKKGQFVKDKKDECVLTKWQAHDGGCNPKEPVIAAEPALPAPSPIRRLTREQKTVYFRFDKYNLTDDAVRRLKTVIHELKRSKDVERVDIVGYADEIGTDGYNQKLSAKRANSVASYMESQGIRYAEVTDVRALGELAASPRCKNIKERSKRISCLAPDRRVEVEVVYSDDADGNN